MTDQNKAKRLKRSFWHINLTLASNNFLFLLQVKFSPLTFFIHAFYLLRLCLVLSLCRFEFESSYVRLCCLDWYLLADLLFIKLLVAFRCLILKAYCLIEREFVCFANDWRLEYLVVARSWFLDFEFKLYWSNRFANITHDLRKMDWWRF